MIIRRIRAAKIQTDPGCFPARIVVLEIQKGENLRYSTHLEVVPPGKKPYFVYGEYAEEDKKRAMQSFSDRLEYYRMTEDLGFEPDEKFTEI